MQFFVDQMNIVGTLDNDTIVQGLCHLGPSADGMHQVYLNLSIPVSFIMFLLSLMPVIFLDGHMYVHSFVSQDFSESLSLNST